MFLATWKEIPQSNEVQSSVDNVSLTPGTLFAHTLLTGASVYFTVSVVGNSNGYMLVIRLRGVIGGFMMHGHAVKGIY